MKKQHFAPDSAEGLASVYVHIPFCTSKCPYCSFVSYADTGAALKNAYMKALRRQARQMAMHPWSRARNFRSLFIGGGTPSTIKSSTLAAFISGCLGEFDFTGRPGMPPEVTLEANPNTVTPAILAEFKAAGVNRLSIGIQSFSDSLLQGIGRRHTAHEGMQAFAWAREAGFANINLDVMYGLPGQDDTIWTDTLQKALALAPEHLSVYELTIEEGTPFAGLQSQGRLRLPPEETTLSMFVRAQEFLAAAGYEQYEISNYASKGKVCIHNMNYWENGSYIGLGSSAVSCFSGVRIKNVELPEDFVSRVNNSQEPYREAEFLPREARFRETVIMGLRMTAGIPVARLQQQFGMTPLEYYGDALQRLVDQGLLEEDRHRLRLTKRGMLLANRIMQELV